MTSNQRIKETLPPSTTRFFKVITTSICQDEKLRIPNGFIMKHKNDISNPMFLKTPDDKKWEMHVAKVDNGFWFQKGWKEFATYYSLDHGHMIFFEYEGNSHFVVHIFGLSTLEIEYPLKENHHEQDNFIEISDDDSVEILDKSTSCKKKSRPKSPISYPRSHKKLRSDTNKDVGTISKFHNFCEHHVQANDDTSGSVERQRAKHEDVQENEQIISKINDTSGSVECQRAKHEDVQENEQIISKMNEALNRARSFKSKNPSFMIAMKSSYLSYSLYVPTKFIKNHLKKGKSDILLQLIDGRTWDVKYSVGKLRAGWTKFVGDNKLTVGDVCVFELTKSKVLTFKVLIFRVEESHFPLSQESDQRDKDMSGVENQTIILDKDKKAAQRTSLRTKTHLSISEDQRKDDKFNSKYPFFKVNITMIDRGNSRLTVPINFIRKYLGVKKEQTVVLKFGKKSWPVKLFCYSDKRSGQISGGWNQFWKENKLKSGDVCVFELIKNKDAILRVHIFRGN
ncbi:B3 domain-containing transcription factor VRN1-like [Vicia villosa]|uniref:B3 domain-containing transcription factor VRN1-like n=1 Tax=Vicia villosa TaxID=3911 RepID=UPI00273AE768|nr:B3 domain-containing transcription factor VRN1-like [Vicia villosa]